MISFLYSSRLNIFLHMLGSCQPFFMGSISALRVTLASRSLLCLLFQGFPVRQTPPRYLQTAKAVETFDSARELVV